MSKRCSYKLRDGSRCTRNGTGSPALCRAHAVETVTEGTGLEDFLPPELLEPVDRFISQSRSEIVRGLRDRIGAFLSDLANTRASPTAPGPAVPPQGWDHPPRPRPAAPPPPPPPPPKEDPREVLGFAADYKLTKELVKERRKALAALYHPDKPGGSVAAMQRVNRAADELLRMLS